MEALPENVDEAIRAGLRALASDEPSVDVRSCPGEEALASYAGGLLGSRGSEKIERHLLKCERCRETVLLSHRVVEAVGDAAFSPLPEPLLERLLELAPTKKRSPFEAAATAFRNLVQALPSLRDALPMWTMQPATIRGSGVDQARGLLTIRRTFKTFKVVIQIERLDDQHCEVKVHLVDRADRPMQHGVRISLLSGQRELASFMIERGEALFEEVQTGKYVIRIANQKLERGEVPLHIKGE